MSVSSDSVFMIEARQEAHPSKWDGLTKEQQDAARKACGIVNWLAARAQSVDHKDHALTAYTQIEHERRNLVVLFDGGRGSGKTTLMLTVLAVWKSLLSSPHDAGVDSWRKERLVSSDQLIIPLDVIDLRALRSSTSLILHVANMLRAVVEMIEPPPDQPGARGPVPWSPNEGFQLESRKRWGAFLRAAAITWDGNLQERKAHIDPESFVAELEMTERDRLDVVPTFRAFVDALTKDYFRWMGGVSTGNGRRGEPLFVIPVDDADMNPDRVAEVLQLTELLRHPRVAFLIAGDSELFVATLKVHFAGAIRAPTAGMPLSLEELHQLGVAGQPGDLARRLYDKLVPSHHRCLIYPIPVNRRESILLDEGPFGTPKVPAVVQALRATFEQQPTGRYALPDRMRKLLEYRQWLESDRPADPDEAVGQFVRRLWEEAVLEENYLTKEERERLDGCVTLVDQDVRGITRGVPLSANSPDVINTYYMMQPLRTPPIKPILPNNPSLNAALYLEAFEIEPKGDFRRFSAIESSPATYDNVPLTSRTVGAWLLAQHVSPPATQSFSSTATADVQIAGIQLSLLGISAVRVAWTLPKWDTGDRRFETLRLRWFEVLRRLRATEQPVEAYSLELMSIVLQLIGGDVKAANAPDNWGQVATELVKTAQGVSPTDTAATDWLNLRAPLWAAPESGVEEASARNFLFQLQKSWGPQLWPNLKTQIDQVRSKRMQEAILKARSLVSPASAVVTEVEIQTAITTVDTAWTSNPWKEADISPGSPPK